MPIIVVNECRECPACKENKCEKTGGDVLLYSVPTWCPYYDNEEDYCSDCYWKQFGSKG